MSEYANYAILVVIAILLIIVGLEGNLGKIIAVIFTPDIVQIHQG
jgi:hypothetical protein